MSVKKEKLGMKDTLGIVLRKADGTLKEIEVKPPRITEEYLRHLLEEIKNEERDN